MRMFIKTSRNTNAVSKMRMFRSKCFKDSECETVVLTKQRLKKLENVPGISSQKGYNSRTLAGLGVGFPLKSGWLSSLIGTSIPRELYEKMYYMNYWTND